MCEIEGVLNVKIDSIIICQLDLVVDYCSVFLFVVLLPDTF